MVRVHTLAAQSPLNVSHVLRLHAQLVLDGLHGLVTVLVGDEHPPVSRVRSLTLCRRYTQTDSHEEGVGQVRAGQSRTGQETWGGRQGKGRGEEGR